MNVTVAEASEKAREKIAEAGGSVAESAAADGMAAGLVLALRQVEFDDLRTDEQLHYD